MFKFFKTATAIAAGTMAAAAAYAAPLSTWYGSYGYEHSVGRDGSGQGNAAYVTYTLNIGPDYGNSGCTLSMQGYQTSARMLCTAMPEGDSVVIKYYTFQSGQDRTGFARGDRLLTLTRTNNGIVTRWQSMMPEGGSGPRAFRPVG